MDQVQLFVTTGVAYNCKPFISLITLQKVDAIIDSVAK